MKVCKRVATVAALLLVSAFVFSVLTVRVPAGPPAPVATENGDANGDGVVDVADAVHILFFLFKGGPAPVAVAATSPVIEERVTSIDASLGDIAGHLSDVSLKMDVLAQALTDVAAGNTAAGATPCEARVDRFVDNGNGTVTDVCSGLMWQQTDLDANGNPVAPNVDWVQALDYANRLTLGGHTDWRLPSIHELDTLRVIRPSQPETRNVDQVFFLLNGSRFWSSTERPRPDDSNIWLADFRVGQTNSTAPKTLRDGERLTVLAVRDLVP